MTRLETTADLEDVIARSIPSARHMGVRVETVTAAEVVLLAPLAGNTNDKGTGFAGSSYSLAVLAGWAWVTRHVTSVGIDANVMIRSSTVHYRKPVTGSMRAVANAPSSDMIEILNNKLLRAGRGSIPLAVKVMQGDELTLEFDGVYVVVV